MPDPTDGPDPKVVSLMDRIKERDEWKPPLTSVPGWKSESDCRHGVHSVVVDAQARRVRCDGCGVDLDPIDAIVSLARCSDRFVEADRRLKSTRKSLEALLKEERRTKERLRRARAALKILAEG